MLFAGCTVKFGLTEKLLIHLSLVLIPFVSCAVEQLGPGPVDRHGLVLLAVWTFRAESGRDG